jgi:hypothetical protein
MQLQILEIWIIQPFQASLANMIANRISFGREKKKENLPLDYKKKKPNYFL